MLVAMKSTLGPAFGEKRVDVLLGHLLGGVVLAVVVMNRAAAALRLRRDDFRAARGEQLDGLTVDARRTSPLPMQPGKKPTIVRRGTGACRRRRLSTGAKPLPPDR